jgi:hypothetical protein
MNRQATTVIGTIALVLLLGTSHLLDGPEDHSAGWLDSATLRELQASEAGTARRERAGQALCTEARGPNSEARWIEDGSLVCTTRRGVQPMTVARGEKP